MFEDFLLFLLVGALAQFVDGAVGMAYGVTASSFLLAAGVPPAHTSASTHIAKFFTTAASGYAHSKYGNVDWSLFWRLAVAGALGGIGGAYVLTSIPGDVIKPFIIFYLACMGIFILWRMLMKTPDLMKYTIFNVAPVALLGGFLDAIGGGGWGPITTTTLVGRGGEPRFVIGSVNASEFVVTLGIGSALIWAFATGHWKEGAAIVDHAPAIAGLIVGGLITAPIAGRYVSVLPRTFLGVAVGVVVLSLAAYQAAVLAKLF
ncbi:MAG: sulfite exporter TauE/SafE family protein [Micropepsaceae bacterium]